jgi:hypothetical protein
VHDTVVFPTGNTDPLAGVQTMLTGGDPKDEVATPYTTDVGLPVFDFTVTGVGHEIFGGSGATGVD